MLGWLNECRGALFITILWMWTSRQSKLTVGFFTPVWESGLIFRWKTAKNYVFRIRPLFRKNSKFDLLGWLNECRDSFLIVIILKWTSRQGKSPFLFFNIFGKFFLVVFKSCDTFFENGVVWCPRLCQNEVACERWSSVNSGAWLRRFDDETGVKTSCVAKSKKENKWKKMLYHCNLICVSPKHGIHGSLRCLKILYIHYGYNLFFCPRTVVKLR